MLVASSNPKVYSESIFYLCYNLEKDKRCTWDDNYNINLYNIKSANDYIKFVHESYGYHFVVDCELNRPSILEAIYKEYPELCL